MQGRAARVGTLGTAGAQASHCLPLHSHSVHGSRLGVHAVPSAQNGLQADASDSALRSDHSWQQQQLSGSMMTPWAHQVMASMAAAPPSSCQTAEAQHSSRLSRGSRGSGMSQLGPGRAARRGHLHRQCTYWNAALREQVTESSPGQHAGWLLSSMHVQ